MYSGRCLSKVLRNILPPSSGLKSTTTNGVTVGVASRELHFSLSTETMYYSVNFICNSHLFYTIIFSHNKI
jgi:hypothetical protein